MFSVAENTAGQNKFYKKLEKHCVKEQPVQEYLTDSSGILGQINLKTLNNVHAIAPNIFAITFIKK